LVIVSVLLISWQNADYWVSLFHFDFSGNTDYVSRKVSFFDLATPNISLIVFWIILILLSIMSVVKKYSLIPLLGLATCLYLLTGMTKSNWVWFLGWLLLGLIIYFIYGFKHSKLKGQ
jgi:hypothetical protein